MSSRRSGVDGEDLIPPEMSIAPGTRLGPGGQRADPQFVRTSLETALRLDPTLAAAHGVLAVIEGFLEFNWLSAERRCRQAVEIDPRNAQRFADLRRRTGL